VSLATAGAPPSGSLGVSRWSVDRVPQVIPPGFPTLDVVADIFTYAPAAAGAMEWHFNFADPYLFFAYGTQAFAQDEIQVAEHPILASVREALLSSPIAGLPAMTVDESGIPTPMLFSNVQRHCSIDLAGIYGRAFDRATQRTIEKAVRPVRPTTRSNILAIPAPLPGSGRYSRAQIEGILQTAASGFAAVREESRRLALRAPVVVHTGHWGTGAFGGDRTLMAILQLLAARLSGLDRVVYHVVDEAGRAPVEKARTFLGKFPGVTDLAGLVDEIDSAGFRWGLSDGN
jgi:hypothetical protein